MHRKVKFIRFLLLQYLYLGICLVIVIIHEARFLITLVETDACATFFGIFRASIMSHALCEVALDELLIIQENEDATAIGC